MSTGDAYWGHDVRARDWCREPYNHDRCRQTLALEADRAARRDIYSNALAPAVFGIGGMATAVLFLLRWGLVRGLFID